MAWTRIDITEASLLGGTYHRLCRRFQQAFIAAGAPADMALFAQTFPVGETRTLFLTPASRAHLGDLHAQGEPCAAPSAQDVTLVFGVPDAEQHLLGPLSLDADSAAGALRLPDVPLPEARLPDAQLPEWRYAVAP